MKNTIKNNLKWLKINELNDLFNSFNSTLDKYISISNDIRVFHKYKKSDLYIADGEIVDIVQLYGFYENNGKLFKTMIFPFTREYMEMYLNDTKTSILNSQTTTINFNLINQKAFPTK